MAARSHFCGVFLHRTHSFFSPACIGEDEGHFTTLILKIVIFLVALHNKPNIDLLTITTDGKSARARRSQGPCAAL